MPLVLCVDQLEDTGDENTQEKPFRRVVGTLVALTSVLPTAVVVIACLEDYYTAQKQWLTKPQIDRVESDPETIRLTTQRTLEEIEAIISRRLECLYDEAGVAVESRPSTFPFTRAHLTPLTNMRTRDVLNYCRLHRERCMDGGWVEPGAKDGEEKSENGSCDAPPIGLEQSWNDFHTQFQATIPDDEESKASILAEAIARASDELSSGHWFGAETDGRMIPVDSHGPDNTVARLLVGICDKSTRGAGLGNQITALEKRAGEIRAVVVRSTNFPAAPKAVVNLQIGKLVAGKHWRHVVIEDADWRRMLAMQEFREQQRANPDLPAWLRQSRPLTRLSSLQKILALDSLPSAPAVGVHTLPPARPEPPPAPIATNSFAVTASGPLFLGTKRNVAHDPVTLEPNSLVQHMAFLGGSGSGKTTAALNLLEQLLLRGVPAVLLDRKGDLCRYADPAAWTTPLASPEQQARRQRLRERLDIALYTPGQPNGRPLSIPLVPEGKEQLTSFDREQLAGYAAAALGGMMNYRTSGADQKKRAVLCKAVEMLGEFAGKEPTLPNLIRFIADGDESLFAAVGHLGDAKLFKKVADDLQALELNQRRLLAGDAERLNLDSLLGINEHAKPGKTRLSIISTRFLTDGCAVEFWVSQFLTAIGRWIGRQPRDQLQAVFLFDEADLYLPAQRQPATKAPMENLLKRGRSAGVGVFLATQSPGDFDYKCRDNITTWLVGKVKEPTALTKLKPMFSECRFDVAGKLPVQETGQFHLLREKDVIALQAAPSMMKTEQVPEDRILELARAHRQPIT